MTRRSLLLRLGFGLFDFLDVFGRIFVEIFETALAAELDLAALILVNVRLPHAVEIFIRYGARLERVSLQFLVGLIGGFIGCEPGEGAGGKNRDHQGGCGDFVLSLHNLKTFPNLWTLATSILLKITGSGIALQTHLPRLPHCDPHLLLLR
jgi:hypothetical protein